MRAVKTCDQNLFEKFTNADYERIENQDFRAERYKKRRFYNRDSDELSDFTEQGNLIKSDGSGRANTDPTAQLAPLNQG